MDLASGYSDSINYGNGYTPLATGAINNNNADYLRNQMAVAMMAQAYNPYANSGGSFGAQPAAYAGIGADYGRAVGGGGNIYAPQQQSVFETGADPYQDWLRAGGYNAPANWRSGGSGGGDPGAGNLPGDSFSDRFGNMPGQPYGQGYFDNTFGSVANTGGTSFAPYQGVQPMTPQQPMQYPQAGGFAADPYQDWLRAGGYNAPSNWNSGGYQQTGLSMRDRADPNSNVPSADIAAWELPMYPNQQQVYAWQRDQRAKDSASTHLFPQEYENQSDMAPGWGNAGRMMQFPTGRAYPDADPRTDLGFGSDRYPLIGIENNNNYNRPDPNIRDTWLNAS